MARTPLYLEVKDTFGNVVPNAVVTVRKRSDNSLATLWQAETGGTTMGNPMSSDSLGRVQAYVDRGAYNVSVTGTSITPYTVPFDGAAASNRSVDPDWRDSTLLTVAQFLALTAQLDGTLVRVQLVAPTASAPGQNILLRYNAGSAHAAKWEVEGESPDLIAESTAAVSTTSTTYVTPTSAVSMTLPLSGVADMYAYASDALVLPPAGATSYGWLSYAVGATGAQDADAAKVSAPSNATGGSSGATGSSVRSAPRRKTVTAGDIVTPKFRSLAATTTFVPNNAGAGYPYGVVAKYVAVVGP